MERIDLSLAAGKTQSAQQQILAIVITHDGYSFCTAGGSPREPGRLFASALPDDWERQSPAEQFEKLKQLHPELDAPYKEVRIAYDSPRMTFVPASVYREGTGTDYFELVFGRVENEQLHRDTLKSLDLEAISALPIGWSNAAALHFSHARPYAADALMSVRLQREVRNNDTQTIYLRLATDSLSSWHYKGNSLQGYNRQYVEKAEDVLYFASLLASQQPASVYYFGYHAQLEETVQLLSRYFEEVLPLPADPAVAFDPQLGKINQQQLQLLFACLCA